MTKILVTDPPYGATGFKWDDYTNFIDYLKKEQDNFDAMIIFCNHLLLRDMSKVITKKFHDIVIWDKNPHRNWVSWSKPLHHIELITFWGENKYFDFRKSKQPQQPYKRSGGGFKGFKKRKNKVSYPMFQQIWKINEPRKKRHVAQKPVELLINLIQIIEHNEDLIVVDPFEGTGTTGQACAQLGVKYKGYDSGVWLNEGLKKNMNQKGLEVTYNG